jgi:uncharacterized protein YkwD
MKSDSFLLFVAIPTPGARYASRVRNFFSAMIGSLLLTACSNHAAAPPPEPPPQPGPTAQPTEPPAQAGPAGAPAGSTQQTAPAQTAPAQTTPAQTSPAQTAPPLGASDPSWPAAAAAMEQEVLEALNAKRAAGAKCGRRSFGPAAPLAMHPALRSAARNHSLDMANRNYFDHVSKDGRTPDARVRAAGFTASTLVGENIASGRDTAAGAVEQWMASPGHCTNVMNPKFRHLGVGYASRQGTQFTHYWTLTFGGE